jgi:Spx/MgsR family transcriptional regulator
MITVYGIPTCGSVQKARRFLKQRGIEHGFVDFRKTPVGAETIEVWLKKSDIKTLFNSRGTKYRTLGLAQKNLTDDEKAQWLAKENLLIKRPVITLEDGTLLVGFDEERYKNHL